MGVTIVKLAYKQVIDTTSAGAYERAVFTASYDEFLLKSQAYNLERKYKTFTELKAKDGRANSLHYKLSFAIGHFIETLDNVIPVLRDNMDNTLKFETPKFELIESDLTDRSAHKVAINYITENLTLIDVIGGYYLLAKYPANLAEPTETFMVKMQPNLSIASYQLQSSVSLIPLSAHYRQ